MEIQTLFSKNEKITIDEYLKRIGIKNVKAFLNPTQECIEDSNHYTNLQKLVNYVKKNKNEISTTKHYILQDCDADGFFSSALLYIGLVKFGVKKENIITLFHEDKRHGLNDDIVAQIKEDGVFLWLPDSNVNEQKYATNLHKRKIKIISLDHHNTPHYHDMITINNQLSSKVLNKALCGTGVVYKFLSQIIDISNLSNFVSFANVADVMDMRSIENRYFSSVISKVNNSFLLLMCEKWIRNNNINNTTVAWNIIPKINAVMRSNNQQLKKNMFYAIVNNMSNMDILKQMENEHRKQTKIVKELTEQMRVYDWGKICIGIGETSNYSGLIANKLQSSYNKPAICFELIDDNYVGSCRSPYDLQSYCLESKLFNFASGHREAFGVSINKDNIRKLKKYFLQNLPEKIPYSVCAAYNVNSIPEYLWGYFDNYKSLCGQNVPFPEFLIYNININSSQIYVIGNNKTTIKFNYNGIDFIQFFVSNIQKEKYHIGENVELELSVIGLLTNNNYNDNIVSQIEIKKIEIKERKQEFDLEEMFR